MEKNNRRHLFIIIIIILLKYFSDFFLNELGIYIISPFILILSAIFLYYLSDLKADQINFKSTYEVLSIVIVNSFIYVGIYLLFGLFLGYANNLLGTKGPLLYINLFRVVVNITTISYLKHIYINQVKEAKENKSLFIYIVLFSFIELNPLKIISSISSLSAFLTFLFVDFVNVFAISAITIYLVYKSGLITVLVFLFITKLPMVLLKVLPKTDSTMMMILAVCLGLITYLAVEYKLDRVSVVNKRQSFSRSKTNLFYYLSILSFSIFIVLFSLGAFPIMPISILTNSMYPEISPGDLILVDKRIKDKNLEVGTIIQFKKSNISVVHRIIEVVDNAGEKQYVTKGDNNISKDSGLVLEEDIVGTVNHKISYFGYPRYLLHKYFKKADVDIEIGR